MSRSRGKSLLKTCENDVSCQLRQGVSGEWESFDKKANCDKTGVEIRVWMSTILMVLYE